MLTSRNTMQSYIPLEPNPHPNLVIPVPRTPVGFYIDVIAADG